MFASQLPTKISQPSQVLSPLILPKFDRDKLILLTVIYCNSCQALVVIFVRVSWGIFGATRDRLGCKDKVDRSAVA